MRQALTAAFALAAALAALIDGAFAFDDAKYPDLRGQWKRAVWEMPRFNQAQPVSAAEGAPLNRHYRHDKLGVALPPLERTQHGS